jgi:hypothetical protein
MSEIRSDVRRGWTMNCPDCRKPIKYTRLRDPNNILVFFYATDGTEILCRRSDSKLVEDAAYAFRKNNKDVPIEVLEEAYDKILETAPRAESGAGFALWSYVRCPFCNHAFDYRGGVQNPDLRLREYEMIVLDGVVIVDDDERRRITVTAREDNAAP